MSNSAFPPIAVKEFWPLIGQRALGACIAAASDADGPKGFLALSAAHVTADPPTMLVSIGRTTSALQTFLNAKHFALSFLPEGEQALADSFAGKGDLKGADRFKAGDWTKLKTGAPVFSRAVAALDCVLDGTVERPNVVIAFGLVVGFSLNPERKPLIALRGGYL